MRNRTALIGCVAVACLSAPSRGGTVKQHCGKGSSTAEMAQCAEDELQAAEAQMRQALSQAVAQYTPLASERHDAQQVAWEQKIRGELNASQAAWADYVRISCGAVADTYDNGTLTEVNVPECKTELMQQRTKFLQIYFGSRR
jgi:uncharacterized protein YecT (DUF1311 family)